MEFPHARNRERGLVMIAGETLRIGFIMVTREPIMWIRCIRGLQEISGDGLDVEVWYRSGAENRRRLLSFRLENGQSDSSLYEIEIELPVTPGDQVQFELRCGPGPQGQGDSDWLGLLGLVICARGELPLMKARSQREWRLSNEIGHFAEVYSGGFYRDRQLLRSGAKIGALRELPAHGT